jgi:hypothetical protein
MNATTFKPNLKEKSDPLVLSYLVLRIRAALHFVITSREPDFLGSSAQSICPHWEPFSELLLDIAKAVASPVFLGWDRAARVGLTGSMLGLKREVFDLTLGRKLLPRDLQRIIINHGARAARTRAGFGKWFEKDILIRGGSVRDVNSEAALGLAKELLLSLAKILGIGDRIDALAEFIGVIEAAIKMKRGEK